MYKSEITYSHLKFVLFFTPDTAVFLPDPEIQTSNCLKEERQLGRDLAIQQADGFSGEEKNLPALGKVHFIKTQKQDESVLLLLLFELCLLRGFVMQYLILGPLQRVFKSLKGHC